MADFEGAGDDVRPMSARELHKELGKLVHELIRRAIDSPLGDSEIDTNLWIYDKGVLKSFSFEGREIDGVLQGVIVPEEVGDPEGWIRVEEAPEGLEGYFEFAIPGGSRVRAGFPRFEEAYVGRLDRLARVASGFRATYYRPAPKGPADWRRPKRSDVLTGA